MYNYLLSSSFVEHTGAYDANSCLEIVPYQHIWHTQICLILFLSSMFSNSVVEPWFI